MTLLRTAILCLFAAFSAAPSAHAFNKWATGFELGSVTAGVEWNTNAGANQAVVTTPVRSGTYAYRSQGAASVSESIHAVLATDTLDNVFIGYWLYIATAPSSNSNILRWENTLGSSESTIRLNTDRTLGCWSTTQHGSSSTVIPQNEWHHVGVSWNETTDTAECFLDGVSFASGVGPDLGGGAQVSWGFQQTTTGVIFIDDLIYNNDAGTGLEVRTLLVNERVVHLQPNGAGDTTTSISLGGSSPAATAWQSVDEVTPNDNVDIASMTATGSIMDLAMQDASTAGIGAEDEIRLVAPGGRIHADTAAACTWAPGVKSSFNGVVSSGSVTTINTVPWATHDDTANVRRYRLISYEAPSTPGTAWSATTLDTLQIRTFTTDAAPIVGISKVWAMVVFLDNEVAAPAVDDKQYMIIGGD